MLKVLRNTVIQTVVLQAGAHSVAETPMILKVRTGGRTVFPSSWRMKWNQPKKPQALDSPGETLAQLL